MLLYTLEAAGKYLMHKEYKNVENLFMLVVDLEGSKGPLRTNHAEF